MSTTTTYHGDPEFRAAFLAEIAKHEAADAIVQADRPTRPEEGP